MHTNTARKRCFILYYKSYFWKSGRFIGQIVNTGETANLILIPVTGGETHTITDLGKGVVNSFGWSADGRKIIYLLTTESYDAVSLVDF